MLNESDSHHSSKYYGDKLEVEKEVQKEAENYIEAYILFHLYFLILGFIQSIQR